jgi:hypothetical protein
VRCSQRSARRFVSADANCLVATADSPLVCYVTVPSGLCQRASV